VSDLCVVNFQSINHAADVAPYVSLERNELRARTPFMSRWQMSVCRNMLWAEAWNGQTLMAVVWLACYLFMVVDCVVNVYCI